MIRTLTLALALTLSSSAYAKDGNAPMDKDGVYSPGAHGPTMPLKVRQPICGTPNQLLDFVADQYTAENKISGRDYRASGCTPIKDKGSYGMVSRVFWHGWGDGASKVRMAEVEVYDHGKVINGYTPTNWNSSFGQAVRKAKGTRK